MSEPVGVPSTSGSKRLHHDGVRRASSDEDNQRAAIKRQKVSQKNLTYRLRGIPHNHNREEVKILVERALQSNDGANIRICSLAQDPRRERELIATLELEDTPPFVLQDPENDQWDVQVERYEHGSTLCLTFDTHFRGTTPLHNQKDSECSVDLLALSGLGGHAFGSFKEKGGNHMWLRDSLPLDLPGMRIFTYGYSSALENSQSFQNIRALGTSLRSELRNLKSCTNRGSRNKDQLTSQTQKSQGSSNRPLLLIGHSLGGLVIKQAIIQMANGDILDTTILKSIYAILFFGVPSQGMSIESLATIVGNGPNRPFLESLGEESDILREQRERFPDAFPFRDSEIISFYETKLSPTAIKEDGKWRMTGKSVVLVNSLSATHSRPWEMADRYVHAIDRTHSDLVKFKFKDEVYDAVLTNLSILVDRAPALIEERFHTTTISNIPTIPTAEQSECLRALAFVDVGSRQVKIDKAFGSSCDWLFANSKYKEWYANEQSLLWVKGKPGSGKSTLLEFALRQDKLFELDDGRMILAHFFNARGASLEYSYMGMLRSLLHQILPKHLESLEKVATIFQDRCRTIGKIHKDWTWQEGELKEWLAFALSEASKRSPIHVYLDALDESGEATANALIAYFQDIIKRATNSKGTLRICFTCRHYPIIASDSDLEICVEDENYYDIEAYVESKLQESKMSKEEALEYQRFIEQRHAGVFQWVKLVLRIILDMNRKGRKNQEIIKRIEQSQPDLDSLYDILLRTTETDEIPQSLKLFQWICFAERPLTLEELRHALALDAQKEPKSIQEYHGEDEFTDSNEAMHSRLQDLSKGLAEVRWNSDTSTVQLVHQSVTDFLLKDGFHILQNFSAISIAGQAHFQLSRSCIRIFALREIVQEFVADRDDYIRVPFDRYYNRFPLVGYASEFWFIHAEKVETEGIDQSDIVDLFQWPFRTILDCWLYALEHFSSDEGAGLDLVVGDSDLVHVCARAGLFSSLKVLLCNSPDLLDSKDSLDLTPLHHAVCSNNEKSVRLLLDHGADVNAVGLDMETPLSQACISEHGEKFLIVQLLLKHGADINAVGGYYGNALQAACVSGHIQTVELLLKSGADIHIEGGDHGNALLAAASCGHNHIIETLLTWGMDIRTTHADCGTMLICASRGGQVKTVQLLLDAGADINTQGGNYGNALQAASASGYEQTVQLLLDAGADINAQGGFYGSALQAASARGSKQTVQLLLDAGADMNIQSGNYGNALQAASACGSEQTVQLLLDAGADVNTQGGNFGNALQAASAWGSEQTVQLLLDAGADIHAQGGYFGNALQAASVRGNISVVRVLLHSGANVNTQGGEYGNALQAASHSGRMHVVQVLLESGAHVDVDGGRHGRPLLAAALFGHTSTVQLLLDHGSDVNAQGSECGSPLHDERDILKIRRLTRWKGLEPCRGTDFKSALQAAALGGHRDVIRKLLHGGVDVNAPGGKFGSALEIATQCGDEDVVEMLQTHMAKSKV